MFASPERTLLFDINDFDETLPGPFEYDVERLAASFVIAARNNGFSKDHAREATDAAIGAYRKTMREFAEMRTLDVWYSRLDAEDLLDRRRPKPRSANEGRRAAARRSSRRRRTKDSLQALSKLAEVVDGRHRIVSHAARRGPGERTAESYGMSADEVHDASHGLLRAYRSTLTDDRRHLLERFELVDLARKVVGVGSVGTRAGSCCSRAATSEDPLFLQVKEADASVLEDHLPKSSSASQGERVVRGSG